MKLKITKVTERPFVGNEGKEISYYWYKGLREGDGVTINFGSKNEFSLNDEVDLDLEKTELANGKFQYKEVWGNS